MVSIEEAITLIDENTFVGNTKTTNCIEALGGFLSSNVYSPINMPPFHQSAMDGYAVCYNNTHQNNFFVNYEVKAGDQSTVALKPGEAARIFTGAPIPQNANAVIMQEKTSVNKNILVIEDDLTHFKNIRPKGEQIEIGGLALKKDSFITPATVGYLATLGITEVDTYQKPNITIVVTGNELVSPGTPLKYGQIYESNALMLQAALTHKGFNNIDVLKVKDNFDATKTALNNAIEKSDFVLVSGGISVGDYDFVGKALLELGTKQIFYKVNQKPGKPLFFGTLKNTSIFALPGNPASALTCYYAYIEAVLQKFIGNPNYTNKTNTHILKTTYQKKGIRAEYLKAYALGNEVEILPDQSSAMLNSYTEANALICLPEGRMEVTKNTPVKTLIIL